MAELRHREDDDSSRSPRLLRGSDGAAERGIHVPAAGVTGEMAERQIGDGVITAPKIALDAVDETAIKDAAVTQVKIALGAVDTAQLADAAVDNTKLQDLAVDAAKLADDSVETTKIANAAVGSAAIANLAVGNAHVQDAAIDTVKIADAAISSAKIADLAVVDAKIDSVTADKLVAGSTITVNLDVTGTLTLSGTSAAFRSSTGGRRVAIEQDDALYLYDGADTDWLRFRTSSSSPAGLWLEDEAGNLTASWHYGEGSSVWADTTSAGAFIINQYGTGQALRIRTDVDDDGALTPVLEVDEQGRFVGAGGRAALHARNPGDSRILLDLEGERTWRFLQRGTGTTSSLELQTVSNKKLHITDSNRSVALTIEPAGSPILVVQGDITASGGTIRAHALESTTGNVTVGNDLTVGGDGEVSDRLDATNVVGSSWARFNDGASESVIINSNGDLYPGTDAAGQLVGKSGNRWEAVWAQDGTINTSDAADKTDVEDSDLGLGFIRDLRPVKYRWKDGERPHYGALADQVKKVMDNRGVDFAGYVDPAANGEEGPLGLRYHEFIAPMMKAIDQLAERVEALETA